MSVELANKALESYLKNLLGDQTDNFLASEPESTAIRINNLKSSVIDFQNTLDSYQYRYHSISFNKDGFVLEDDPLPLSHTLSFFEGKFQYQGISSQIPAIILDPQPGQKVLDMAAAPGSKSSQLAVLMQNRGELVLNDSSRRRLQALQVNMQRSGAVNHYTLKNRGENLARIYPAYFDKILLDAPCSALGTLATSREVRSWWSEQKLEKITRIQYQLLVSALKALKTDGELVYSTCTITPEENELMIQKILKKFPVRIMEIDERIGLKFSKGWTKYQNYPIATDMEKARRIWPHHHGMEGFFIIKLQKTEDLPSKISAIPATWKETYPPDQKDVRDILDNISERWGVETRVWNNYRYILTKERIWMVGSEIERIPIENFISGGVLLAEKRLFGWKPVNASVQILSDQLRNNRIIFNEQQLKSLFKNGSFEYANLSSDYYILEYEKRAIGTLYHRNGTVHIRLPHAFNLTV